MNTTAAGRRRKQAFDRMLPTWAGGAAHGEPTGLDLCPLMALRRMPTPVS